jgi:hypothetical protein
MIEVADLQPAGMELLSNPDSFVESLDSLSDAEIKIIVGGGSKSSGGNAVIVNNLAYGFNPHDPGVIFAPVTNIVI